MSRTRTLFAAISIAAVSLLAACGDNGDSAAGATDTTAAAAADTTVADDNASSDTAGETITSDTGSPAPTGPGKDTEFCQFQQELNDMATPFDNQDSGAAEFEQYFKEMVNPAIDKLESLAPDEVKAQMTTLAAGLRQFSAAFEKNGWDPEKAYADPDLQALATNTDYNSAGAAVDEFCGF
ncbi:MAG: hypothetical protein HY828_04295 [Actinobacteria bacterium]|nr:hypothetical protein [Actinomycetota bacterium]